MPGPTKEQYEQRERLHTLLEHPGWQEVYARGVDRMVTAQRIIMDEKTNHEKRAYEVAVWNSIRDLIEWPKNEADYITTIEERAKTE